MKYEKWIEYINILDKYDALNPSKIGFIIFDKDLDLDEVRELCDFAYMKINKIEYLGKDNV